MTEPGAPPARPPRTWRPIILWTAGILLVVGLAWFAGAVAWPLWRTRAEIAELGVEDKLPLGLSYSASYSRAEADARATWLVERFGGAERAARRVRQYLAMPRAIAPDRATAVYLLGFCRGHAVDDLISRLGSQDPTIRACAVEALAMIGPDARKASPRLETLRQDPDKRVREAVPEALSRVRSDSEPWDERRLFAVYNLDKATAAPVENDLSKSWTRGSHGYVIGELGVGSGDSGSSNYFIRLPGPGEDRGVPARVMREDLGKVKKGQAQKFYGVLVGDGHKNYITTLLVYRVTDP